MHSADYFLRTLVRAVIEWTLNDDDDDDDDDDEIFQREKQVLTSQ